MVEKIIIPFNGYPIYKISTEDMLNKDELAFLKSIPEQSIRTERKLKLLEGSNILNNKELQRIKNIIWKHFVDYVDNVLEIKNKFYMCNSWGTIQKKGNHHPAHRHLNAIFSSVFYVDAPNSVVNFFVDKTKIQGGFNFTYDVQRYNEFNSQTWEVPVNTGDILFFPAEMSHETDVHDLSSDRIVIGASYFAKGRYGTEEDYNLIDL
jgi:hypothetical protein|tara:strand:+ start:44 stop:664 length:621 start_codon:yes stop_codon:yes gene_type:complete